MKNLLKWAGALALALTLPCAAMAQSPIVGKSVAAPAGYLPTIAIYCDDGTGHAALCSFTSGSPGSGTGDASASNQTTQIARETSIRDQIGALSSPATGSTNWLLTDVRTALLGTLTVGTHAVTQSGSWSTTIGGTLPAFAATPTFNLGTLNGAATSAKQDSMITALGSPFQAGASIGNTAFGISGTLPAFASTPTVNLGTLNGAATSAKQDAMITALGSPVQAGTTLSNVVQAVATDRGAVVGTSAVQLMAPNAARRGLSIQVQSVAPNGASCYINGTTGATADYHSLQIGPSSYFEPDHHVGTGAISIICTAASTPVYAREW